MDIFGDSFDEKSSKRFKIHSFLAPSKKNGTIYGSSQASKGDNLNLDRAIKEIENSTAKILLEYNLIYKEMMNKRKDIQKDIEEYRAIGKGDIVASFHKTDLDILTSASRILDSKTSAINNKMKSIREERKIFLDKLKASGALIGVDENSSSTSTTSNSPMIAMQTSAKVGGSAGGAYVRNYMPAERSYIEADRKVDETTNSEVESSVPLSPLEKYQAIKKSSEIENNDNVNVGGDASPN